MHWLAEQAQARSHLGLRSPRIGGTTQAHMVKVCPRLVQTHGQGKHINTMDDVCMRELEAGAGRFFEMTSQIWPFKAIFTCDSAAQLHRAVVCI
jgi:hypothetical protein